MKKGFSSEFLLLNNQQFHDLITVLYFRGHIVACELWLKGLRNLKMTEIQLVRNDDLTFSGLKLMIELPFVKLNGKFRL